jgi:hypothetical protein
VFCTVAAAPLCLYAAERMAFPFLHTTDADRSYSVF